VLRVLNRGTTWSSYRVYGDHTILQKNCICIVLFAYKKKFKKIQHTSCAVGQRNIGVSLAHLPSDYMLTCLALKLNGFLAHLAELIV